MPLTREDVQELARQELIRIRSTETGELHQFYSFKPANDTQRLFFSCDASTQVVAGGNRAGKTLCGDQKVIIAALGEDPNHITKDFTTVSDRVYKIWCCVPAKFTREALRDLVGRIPPNVKYKAFWGKGDERIEFAPTERRKMGCVLTIKSYGMPIDEFQREAVDIVRFDEEMPQYVWQECLQRLISTNGQLWLTFTAKSGLTWLHKKLYGMKPKWKNLQDGEFAWFQFSALDNPYLDKDAIALRTKDLSETEYAIRVLGEYRLLAGTNYFEDSYLSIQWNTHAKDPEWSMTLTKEGEEPVFTKYRKDKPDGWKVWKKPAYGARYAIGADVCRGVGGESDYSVAVVLDTATGEMVALFRDNEIDPWEYGRELFLAGRYYRNALIAPETNIEAGSTLYPLREFSYPYIYRRQAHGGRLKAAQTSLGWETNKKSKADAIEELRAAVKKGALGEPGGVIIRDAEVLEELSDFGHLNEKRPGTYGLGGLSGHDDRVMALAIAWQAMKQAPKGISTRIRDYARTMLEKWEQEAISATKAAREEQLE